ncbi:transport and Golgi organization protein 1 homolog isoform X2 [Cavia porcellus]|uniref:transport and Golgi organization protein 1 homolog isoform X2 n=1 Tax=Cavia porcellus TaxID=10141 RepID=UPI002FE1532B
MDTVSATVAGVFVSPGTPELLKPLSKLYSAFVDLLLKLVAVLPENLQPGPGDFYGLPWEPVLLTTCVGILMLAIFLWRNVFPVKERIYQGGENKKAHMHQLMDVSRKDLQLLQLKLRASLSAKCDLEDQIVKLGEDCGKLQADKARLEEEFSMLQQKVEVLKELSHQKELELQKILSQAECAQQQ